MMNFGLPEHILQAITSVLQKRENVTRALIFGSRARGDFKYNSDVDIAVYADGSLPPGLYLDLDEASGIYKIDLVDMNSLHNEKLRQRIEQQGVEIYARRQV